MNNIVYAGKHALTMTVSRHAHSTLELIYCLTGSGELIFDGQTLSYQADDIAIVPAMVPHANMSTEGFTNIHLNLSNPTLANQGPVIIQSDENGYLLNAFSAAFFFYSGDPDQRASLLPAYGNVITSFIASLRPAKKKNEIVKKIQHNIIQNFTDSNYNLGKYLHSLPFNYDYLIKLFRSELGVTPHKYLTDKRLQATADWLSTSQGNNITEIAHLCGFKDPLYFSRLFKKKYGVSPSFYSPEETAEPLLDSDSIKILL